MAKQSTVQKLEDAKICRVLLNDKERFGYKSSEAIADWLSNYTTELAIDGEFAGYWMLWVDNDCLSEKGVPKGLTKLVKQAKAEGYIQILFVE